MLIPDLFGQIDRTIRRSVIKSASMTKSATNAKTQFVELIAERKRK